MKSWCARVYVWHKLIEIGMLFCAPLDIVLLWPNTDLYMNSIIRSTASSLIYLKSKFML